MDGLLQFTQRIIEALENKKYLSDINWKLNPKLNNMRQFIKVSKRQHANSVDAMLNTDTISYFLRQPGEDYTRIHLTVPAKEGNLSMVVDETPEELIKLMHPVV